MNDLLRNREGSGGVCVYIWSFMMIDDDDRRFFLPAARVLSDTLHAQAPSLPQLAAPRLLQRARTQFPLLLAASLLLPLVATVPALV